MSTRLLSLFFAAGLGLAGTSALGQARVFMVPAGDDPTSYPSGQTTVEVEQIDVQAGGFTLTLEIYLENTDPVRVRGYQIVLDDATGGSSGVVAYNPADPPVIDTIRGDYIFAGATSPQGTSVDAGTPARLANVVADAPGNSVAVTTPTYVGEITYEFSPDASGRFNIDFIDPGTDPGVSQTIIADETSSPFAFTADGVGVVINIATGPPVVPPPPHHDARKNRYISFDPNNTGRVAFKVELTASFEFPTSTGEVGWVGPPDANDVARVVSGPYFSDTWPAVVHVGDCRVVPVVTYEIRSTADAVSFSDALEIGTILKPVDRYYGDTVGVGTGDLLPLPGFTPPNGVVNVSDVQAYLLTMQGSSTPSAHTTWVDLHGLGNPPGVCSGSLMPCTVGSDCPAGEVCTSGVPPNFVVNVSDLQRIKFGFAGQRYGDAPEQLDPAACPEIGPRYEPGTWETPLACPGECATCSDDPTDDIIRRVYLFSGECYDRVPDLEIRGRGLDFVWARKYRSRVGPNTAMGNGWDFSYNIRIEQVGPHIRLRDGNTRADVYGVQPDGTWARNEFFRLFEQNPDGTYTLTFADTGEWNFNALDGSPAAGKIASIVDRNANTLTFDYDAQGRLITIHDPLDTAGHNRDILINYNVNGFIETVVDFEQRLVTYEYYDGLEPGGSFGDLKSVTTPAVTGTPNGNDFPNGKTTIYTYSTGFSDDRLNHNLLTITDPKGQTYLTNVYAATQDPSDVNFDRVVRQVWGDPGDIIDAVYVPQAPDPSNSLAATKAIVNDRVGNVKEYFYDDRNRLVIQHEYTGRADPDQPTTDTVNRPTGKLRATDPDLFETRYEYNDDSLLRRLIRPEGSITANVYELEVDLNAPRRSRGNLREIHHLPGQPSCGQSEIVELYEHDMGFGACCGTNFITRHVDGRGNETLHQYDARGNRIHTQHRIPSIVEDREYNAFGQVTARILPDNGSQHRQRNEYTYYDTGPQTGYLRQEVVDVGSFALTTTYEYDPVGNVTRAIDPGGHDNLTVYNQLDQVIRQISRETQDASGVRYVDDTFYDANDNIVRFELQNVGDGCETPTNMVLVTTHDYETLNRRIRTTEEIDESRSVVKEFEYDANRNPRLASFGADTAGGQPRTNVLQVYDERDRRFQESHAAGDSDQSTSQQDYDGNRNVVRVTEGLEGTPRVELMEYDGFDRLIRSTGPTGNVKEQCYDENGNVTSSKVLGEVSDEEGSTGNVRLYEATFLYDAMDRLIRREVEFFDTETQQPLPGGQLTGKSVTVVEYNANSQQVRFVDDNGHETRTFYDTANRARETVDAKGNGVLYTYDANSNVVTRTEVEKSDLSGLDETFVTTHVYDNHDRLIQTIDNVGNTNQHFYDSRDNQVKEIDALGNVTCYEHDGLDRLTRTVRQLTDTGTGAGTVVATIATTDTWEDSEDSRLIARTDDNDNVTSYEYDGLDRVVVETFADGTTQSYSYDPRNNMVSTTDANGTLVTYTYDAEDRLIRKDVTPGPGVATDTTFEAYKYDGATRVVRAEDDDSVVLRSYDSMSNIVRETLNGQTTAATYDGEGNLLTCTYPGGRSLTSTYDELDRKKTVADQVGSIARYDYVGPTRVERRQYVSSPLIPLSSFYLYDGVKRIIRTRHSRIAGEAGEELYGLASNGNLIQIDTTTGQGNLVGNTGLITTNAAASDSQNRLFTIDVDDVILVDPATADASVYRTLTGRPPGFGVTAMAFDGQDNLYVILSSSGEIDRLALAALDPPEIVEIGETGLDGIRGLAFAPGGTLYGIDVTDGLCTLNTQTGQATLIGGSGIGGDAQTIEFAADGTLYAARANLLQLDPTTGDATLIGPIGFSDIRGLAMILGQQGSEITDDRTYAWDPMYNKTEREDVRVGGPRLTHAYAYDSVYRLAHTQVTDASATTLRDTGYTLDGVGNRVTVAGTPDPGAYTMDPTVPEPADLQMNQYTTTSFEDRGYDGNGNLIDRAATVGPPTVVAQLTYDYRNQLVTYAAQTDTGVVDATYAYDVFGRRIARTVNTGQGTVATRYFYFGQYVIEEQDSAGVTVATYVYGNAIDEVLSMQRGSTEYFYFADDLGTVMAVTDANGNVAERYEYGDYGTPEVFDATGMVIPVSLIGNPYLFTGRRYDPETGLYYYRTRYMDPRAGRFVSRDTLGVWEDGGNHGNGYTYVRNNPQTHIDPTGNYSMRWSCYGRTLNFEWRDCGTRRGSRVPESGGNACRAYRAARQARADIDRMESAFPGAIRASRDPQNRLLGPSGPSGNVLRTAWRVIRWFGGPDLAVGERNQRRIRNRLKDIRDAFRNGRVDFECESSGDSDCGSSTVAYVLWPYGWSNIHFCPRYFRMASDNDRADTVLHELAHQEWSGSHRPNLRTINSGNVTTSNLFARYRGSSSRTYETNDLRRSAYSYGKFILQHYAQGRALGSWE